MNVNNSLSDAPTDVRLRATSLFETAGKTFVIADIVLELLRRLEVNIRALAAGDPRLPRAWQAHCALIGREVEVDRGPDRVRGICRGLDAEGALLIDTDRGRERLFGGTLRSIG